MISVFADQISERTKYVFSFYLGQYAKEWDWVDSPSEATIVYSKESQGKPKVYWQNSGILDAQTTEPFEALYPQVSEWYNSGLPSDSHLDFVAFTFHLLSRMEEYNSSHLDEHGRYPYTESLLFKHDFLSIPILDIISDALLGTHYLSSEEVLSTMDVDTTYMYKARPKLRNMAKYLKDLSSFNFSNLAMRWRVLTGRRLDPYEESLDAFIEEVPGEKYLFWLVSQKSEFDNQIDPMNRMHQKKIVSSQNLVPIGLHSSYEACQNKQLLMEEKAFLELVIEKPIRRNRFHYIRFQLPLSYQLLIQVGLFHDWSMGYPDYNGFRAGTARDFEWYDIENEEQTKLRITPFSQIDLAESSGTYQKGRKTKIFHNFRPLDLNP